MKGFNIQKIHTSVITTFILLFLSLNHQSIFAQAPEYSIINVYRPKSFCGSASSFIVYFNNREICRLKNGGHLEYKLYSEGEIKLVLEPGINVGSGNSKETTFIAIRNNTYNYYCGFDCASGRSFLKKFTVPDNAEVNQDKLTASNYISITEDTKRPINRYVTSLFTEKTDWFEYTLKEHWESAGIDEIEGIYEQLSPSVNGTKYKIGLLKENNLYKVIYLSGNAGYNTNLWTEGQVKAILDPTATPSIFKAKWYLQTNETTNDVYVSFDGGSMEALFSDNRFEDIFFIKLFPAHDKNVNVTKNDYRYGTGFAISKEGYLVTNYHIVENAKSISIKGVNNDYSVSFQAKVIINDKNNDLSILKISDSAFIGLSEIPFNISNTSASVGTSIFILGYPLRASMGDELKLTDGIISAKSGFQGDISSYQISAAAQPGNSGGPLFDSNGQLIGVVNAKNTSAENATYAIKSNYLLTLIDMLPNPIKLPNTNSLVGKTLIEQVESISSFVYIIEVN